MLYEVITTENNIDLTLRINFAGLTPTAINIWSMPKRNAQNKMIINSIAKNAMRVSATWVEIINKVTPEKLRNMLNRTKIITDSYNFV